MNHTPFGLAFGLAAALWLVFCASAPAQEGESDIAARFRLGMLAMDQSTRAEPERRDALLDQAIATFRAILVEDPSLPRVRLELARAFFLKGEDRLAKRHFEQVLAGELPPGVVRNVNGFLAQIRARKRWSLRVGAAIAPDTNIGAGSDERIIYIDFGGQRLPFQRDEEELTTSGVGVATWLGGEYQYPISDRWRLRGGGDASRREYRGSRFDQLTVAGYVGPRRLLGRASEASVLLSGVHVRIGTGSEELSYRDVGGRFEARHRLSPADRSRPSPLPPRTPLRPAHVSGRAGDGCLARRRLGRPRRRCAWTPRPAGAGPGRSGSASAIRGAGYAPASRRTCPGASPSAARERCAGPATGAAGFPSSTTAARARTGRAPSACSRTTAPSTLGGFSPQVLILREDRASNAQAHDYKRTSGELRFVRLF